MDTLLIRLEDVEKRIAEGDARLQKELRRCKPTGMPDTIEELRRWAAFREKPAQPPKSVVAPPHFMKDRKSLELAGTPELSRGRRAGRNEPCPCGSGKKYKKCCGARR